MSYNLCAHPSVSNPLSNLETYSLPFGVYAPAAFHFSSKQYADLLFYDSTAHTFSVLINDGTGRFINRRNILSVKSFSSIVVGNLNNDGIDDFIIILRDQNKLIVALSQKRDSTYISTAYPVGYYPEKVTIGDITNDAYPDILCFGKIHSGITVLLGQIDGKFKPAKTLFPNISISDVFIVNLNQDGLTDLAVHSWLTNELTFYFGTGKLRFSEQTVLSFGADSVKVLCSDFNADKITDVAVTSAQNKTVQIYHGDGIGSYNFTQTLSLSFSASDVQNASFNSPAFCDFLVSNMTEGMFSILLNKSSGSFFDEIVYGIDSTIRSIVVADINGDGFDEVVFFHSSDSLFSVLWNANQTGSTALNGIVVLPVGKNPNNLSIEDINSDGFDDILVSNYSSASVSILLSKGNGFEGQQSIEIPDEPMSVSSYLHNDSVLTLFSVHKKNPKIAIVNIVSGNEAGNSLYGDVDVYSIPVPELPDMVLPDISMKNAGISLYVFTPAATNGIVFYQQIKGVKFVSKSLVPVIPTKFLFSTISDLNNDGHTDLVYIYRDSSSQNNYLGITLNDSLSNFSGKVYSFAIPSTNIRHPFVSIEDFNGDMLKDCIIYAEAEKRMYFYSGSLDKIFSPPSVVFPDSLPTTSDLIQIYDYDNDGILDILFKNITTGMLQCAKGRGNGTFLQPQSLFELPKISVFYCGDCNGDGVTDIIYAESFKNSVTVVYGK